MQKFTDYYKLLEVHSEASFEVIRAAYKKLCAVYHPDGKTGSGMEDRMALLNTAYDVLSDKTKRAKYHEEWLAHYNRKGEANVAQEDPPTEETADNAVKAVEEFFHALMNGWFERAYWKLSSDDRTRISYEDFCDWREAVDRCYEMTSYNVKIQRIINDCTVGTMKYKKAVECVVNVKENDRQRMDTASDTMTKYAVYDGNSWKIVLGMYSLKNSIMRYKLLAERTDSYDPILIYKNAAKRIDPLSGLLSEEGLFEEAEKEFYRSRRYRRPLSFMSILVSESQYHKAASLIRRCIRESDCAGIYDGYKIVVVMPETDIFRSNLAEKKMMKLLTEGGFIKQDITIAKVDARQFDSFEEAINSICNIG